MLFGDVMRIDSESRDYEEIRDLGKLNLVLDEQNDNYNAEHSNQMSLVFFQYAV